MGFPQQRSTGYLSWRKPTLDDFRLFESPVMSGLLNQGPLGFQVSSREIFTRDLHERSSRWSPITPSVPEFVCCNQISRREMYFHLERRTAVLTVTLCDDEQCSLFKQYTHVGYMKQERDTFEQTVDQMNMKFVVSVLEKKKTIYDCRINR